MANYKGDPKKVAKKTVGKSKAAAPAFIEKLKDSAARRKMIAKRLASKKGKGM